MSMQKNVESFIGCDSQYDEAGIVLFGAPFDSTTSYRPGSRFGPSAVRHESFGIETYSPYQDADLTDSCCKVFDEGDLELPFGDPLPVVNSIMDNVRTIVSDNKIPFMVGGEHLVTLGAVNALYEKYPDMHVVQFDAHADLRDDYLGTKLSHACVMRRCHDFLGDMRIHQFCIRSGEREEFLFAKSHTHMHKFTTEGIEDLGNALAVSNAPVYLTIDLDCLDSSVLPGTGTPEAGGISFMALYEAVIGLIGSGARIVGVDVNELSPMLDTSGASTALTCKLIREILIALSINR